MAVGTIVAVHKILVGPTIFNQHICLSKFPQTHGQALLNFATASQASMSSQIHYGKPGDATWWETQNFKLPIISRPVNWNV
jgi:hypothetical protein